MGFRAVFAMWLVVCVGGCGAPVSGGHPDAGADAFADSSADAARDVEVDGSIDAGADATGDAGADGSIDSGVDAAVDAGADGSIDSGIDSGPEPTCVRSESVADRPRKLVVSHHLREDRTADTRYEVLDMTSDGVLSRTGVEFNMGRATDGSIRFTPDGEIGVVAQEDGTLGVFRIDDAGIVTVVHSSLSGTFYASDVVIDPSGRFAFVIETGWRNVGGAVYRLAIGCDGALRELDSVPARLASHMLFHEDSAFIIADDYLDSALDQDAILLDFADPAQPAVLGSARPFEDVGIASSAALGVGGQFLLIGHSPLDALGGIAVVSVSDDSLSTVQTIAPVDDPHDLVMSPWGNAAAIISGFGDAVFRLNYDAENADEPFSLVGEISYEGGRPQLPDKAMMLTRGSLRGRFLFAEIGGVRQMQFAADGTIMDLGLFSLHQDSVEFANLVGAAGVQP